MTMTSADHDLPPLSDALPPDTTVLVLAAQQGDRKALEVLFERYLPRVRRIVALRTGRRLEILYEQEDLVQQALMRAFADLHSYEKRSQAQFRNWIARCVEHELADLARKGAAAKRGGALRAGVPPPDRVLAS
ncbi:MAG: hypothetical protein JXA90_14040, partial [Planctomycetes bacterium]|nr:hypothetical protein [Planctomycetota bacterium]